MRLPFHLVFAGCCLALPSTAWGQSECVPEFVQASQTIVTPEIAVGQQDLTLEAFNVAIRDKSGNDIPCSATIRLARASTSPALIPSQLRLESGGQSLQILPRETSPGTSSSDLRISQISGGQTGSNVLFQMGIASGWGIKSCFQTEDLIILLIDASGRIVDTLPLTIQLSIPAAAEIRVVGATGTDTVARIDLGDLANDEATLSERFGIRVWSTSAYKVEFRSQNGGELVQAGSRDRIPYSLLLNQRAVSALTGVAIQTVDGTDALGDFHPLQLQVQPIRARAGNYSDRVSVTVTAS